MADRKTYHVDKNDAGKWQGKFEGAKRASVMGETKAEVLSKTKEIAKNADKPTQVIVHKENGKFQTEYTYKNDPYPPKG